MLWPALLNCRFNKQHAPPSPGDPLMHGTAHVNFPMVVVCTLATAACWGTYGPLLQWGHMAMGSGRLRPFICVGIAYVIIAIAAPILVMTLTGMENEGGL